MWLRRFTVLVLGALTACSSPSAGGGADGGGGGDGGGDAGGDLEGSAAPFRDWDRYPAVAELNPAASQALYFLGDIHGDYDRLVTLLIAAKLLGETPRSAAQGRWTGQDSVLTISGDLIDKWNQALSVIALLQALRSQASAAGGAVVVTMGNHEAELLADPTGSKTADFAAELKAAGIPAANVVSGSHPVGLFLRSLPFAARVGTWFCAHAGNTGGQSLAALAASLRAGLDQGGTAAAILSADDSLLEARLDAPFWEAQGTPEATLTAALQALGVAHLVIGHQPGKATFLDGATRPQGTAYQKFGKIFLLDLGMSRGVDYSKGGVMRVRQDNGKTTATVILHDGSESTLWSG